MSDSLVLRQFCRVYAAPVPDETTLLRWANLLHPATLHRLLDHVVALARALKVTRGRTLRIDGTVVATTSTIRLTARCSTTVCASSAGRWPKPRTWCKRRRRWPGRPVGNGRAAPSAK